MSDENVNPTVEDDPEVNPEEHPIAEDGTENPKADPDDQRAEYVHDPVTMGRDYRVEGNDVRDYIGVDPEYMTYANETDAPRLTDTERFLYTNQYDHLEGNADEDAESESDGESTEGSEVQDSEPGDAGADGKDKDEVDQSSSETSEKPSDAPYNPLV